MIWDGNHNISSKMRNFKQNGFEQMQPKGKKALKERVKPNVHPRNRYQGKYNFIALVKEVPELENHLTINDRGMQTISFFDPKAVLLLNKALLAQYYNIKSWEIPTGYLCPPVPGRADYIHHIADVLAKSNLELIPRGEEVKVLDVGVGANGIYSIISALEYGWSVVGCDIDKRALEAFSSTIEKDEDLTELVSLRYQANPKRIFSGIVHLEDRFDVTICNPPFHASAEEANKGTLRKLRSLKKSNEKKVIRNFEGVSNELWCDGGELKFITQMIEESKAVSTQCFWFTTLVSKQSNVRAIHKLLKKANAEKVETISMGQGNKTSRIMAWTFLSKDQRQTWRANHWG